MKLFRHSGAILTKLHEMIQLCAVCKHLTVIGLNGTVF